MMRAEKRAFFLEEGGGGLASWKEAYYREKLELKAGQPAPLDELRRAYCEGLAWVLQYYYRGVASWGWYYPFHYAPTASDLVGPQLAAVAASLTFKQGEPFKPFEQLLAVLPAASSALLPEPHRRLMLDPSSLIKDFYPLDFKIDFEGKRNDWEGIVQVPFIDEQRLLEAARGIDPARLTAAERQRNAPGPMYAFVYAPTFAEDYPSSLPRSFAGLFPSRCMVTSTEPPPPLPADTPGFGPRLVKGTTTGALSPPGFPTLRTIPATARLQAAGCNVFGMASKKDSLVLRVADLGPSPPGAAQVASLVLNSRCFVCWPYLQEALVVAVSDATGRIASAGTLPGSKTFSKVEADEWASEAARVGGKYLTHQGIDVGRVTVLVHVRTCEGLVKHADGSLQKRFGGAETPFPLQATLRKAPGTIDPRLVERGAEEAPALPRGGPALFLGRSHFGALAHVVEGPLGDGTYTVAVTAFPPDGGAAKRAFAGTAARFERSGALARRLRLSPRLLGQVTGTVFVRIDDATRVDCGLNLKNAKHGLCVPDYCRPAPGDDGWEYSDAAARLVAAYAVKAPWLFKALADDPDGGPGGVDVRAALPGLSPSEAARHAYDAAAWLRKQPAARRPLVKTGAVVPPEEVIRALATATAVPPPPLPPVLLERVAPLLLLPPMEEREAASVLAGGDFGLGDRVTLVGPLGGGATPPFGARGTVVGMHPWEVGSSLEVLFDVDFDGGSDLHGRVPGKRGALVPSGHCLNLTHPPPLPALGAWGPPQRARVQPPAPPPVDGRLAWEGDKAAPAAAPRGALAAAKAALATQMAASALAPPVPPPAAPRPRQKGDAAAAAVAAAAKATARPAPKNDAAPKVLLRRPAGGDEAAAPAAADGKGDAKGKKAANAAAEGAEAAAQASRPRAGAAGGRGSGGASGPSMPDGKGFQSAGQQGRGRGNDTLRFPKQAPPPEAEPAEPEPIAVSDPGRAILAMVQRGGQPPPPPPVNGGALLMGMLRGGAAAPPPPQPVSNEAAAFWQTLAAPPPAPSGADAGRMLLSMVQTQPPPPAAPLSVAELEARMAAQLF
jgi:5'-3' exoribonuclease 1